LFTVSSPDGEQVFFGSNKDHREKYLNITAIWFKPGDEERFGAGYTGWYMPDYEWEGCTWEELPMGGINSAGLCFDMNGVPLSDVNVNESKPSWPDSCYTVYALEHFQTVDEVIDLYSAYKFPDITPSALQLHYADASGDAVVISTDINGSLAFTRKGNNTFLVSSNFNLVNPDIGGYPCSRYTTAVSMLEAIEQNENLTVEALTNVVDAVHVEEVPMDKNSPIHTLYTTIYDLKNKDIYLYYLHDFDNGIKFNLETELSKGFKVCLLADLFNESTSTTTASTTNLPPDMIVIPAFCFVLWLVINRIRKKYHSQTR
jgi:choloylglycine hydrolase